MVMVSKNNHEGAETIPDGWSRVGWFSFALQSPMSALFSPFDPYTQTIWVWIMLYHPAVGENLLADL